jgi:transcriptional regulator with XRE-family HTH domain
MPRFVRNSKVENEFRESIECGEKDWSLYTEKLLLDVREIIAQQMNKGNVSRADLAKLLNCSRSYITQLLNGDTNIKLGTLVKVLFALGVKPSIKYAYENIDSLEIFNKNITFEMDFKESTNTTLMVIENKTRHQEYEPT